MTPDPNANGAAPDPSPRFPGLEQTVLPSPSVVTLDPDRTDLFHERLADADPMVSERYQANSRLRLVELDTLPDRGEEQDLRTWFSRSERTFAEADLTDGKAPLRPYASLPQPLGAFLSKVGEFAADGGLLFVVDAHLVFDGWLWLIPPGQQALVAERRFDDARRQRLVDAIVPDQRPPDGEGSWLITLTTVPWRLQILHGERGYRRSLLETGVAISRLSNGAMAAGLLPTPVVDFAEIAVDDCLFNDGIERFCTSLLFLDLQGGTSA